jgi:hypothetical protein
MTETQRKVREIENKISTTEKLLKQAQEKKATLTIHCMKKVLDHLYKQLQTVNS